MPDSPETARFLTPEELVVARQRSITQIGEETAGKRTGAPNIKEIWAALVDPKNILTALIYFLCNVSFSSLPIFGPAILKGLGYSSINAQGLTAPPYFVAFLCVILTTWIVDRLQQRGFVVMVMAIIGAVDISCLR